MQYTYVLTICLHVVQRDIIFNNLYFTGENNHYRNVLVHYITTLNYITLEYCITLHYYTVLALFQQISE